jgi:Peptidase S46
MRMRRFACALLGALLVLSSLGVPARADEGMWPFNNVPRAEIKKRYGFDVTDAFLKHLQLASVRFNNGGSGSFVSPNGLALTNYHIVEDFVTELSTPEKDYTKTGFLARTPAEEMKIPNLELNVLESIEDVTERVNAGVKPEMSAADALAARRAAIAAIESESTKATGLRSDVVTLYQGGQYNLYRYKKYTDVRLVFVPEFQAAFFGGDPDNFNFPRFNIDMSLVRVYENGQPVHPQEYLKWSTAGAKEGDLTFVTGNPGSTSRLNTVAHLEYLRDTSIPLLIRWLEHVESVMKAYMAQGPEQTRRVQDDLNSIQNALKVYRGQLAGLKDPALIARKTKEEQALRQSIASDPRRQKEYGDAFDTIANERKSFAPYERDRRFLDLAAGFNTTLFQYARALVRYAAESAKPSAERLPEYADNRLPALAAALAAEPPLYPDYEKMKLADSLAFMRDEYGASNPLVQKVLKGETPEARAAELIDGTKLKDPAFRTQLFKGGAAAINASNDPMLELARSIDPEARAVRKRYEDEVVGPERNAYAKIAHALFETEGTKLYPDATFTPRLSFGAVKGYSENGHHVAPFTTLGGLYERAAAHKYQFPYNLPQRWLDRKSSLDLKTPFNFVTTNDIIGGNSGSPTVNREGELVGLIFDGNIQSLVGNFIYDESVNRAISVDSRGMLEVLRKMFDANELVAELTGQTKSQAAGGQR